MPTTQTTFFLLLLYTVLLFPIEAITVSGISSRTGRLASEYWVQGHQIFTNAFEHDDNELGLQGLQLVRLRVEIVQAWRRVGDENATCGTH